MRFPPARHDQSLSQSIQSSRNLRKHHGQTMGKPRARQPAHQQPKAQETLYSWNPRLPTGSTPSPTTSSVKPNATSTSSATKAYT